MYRRQISANGEAVVLRRDGPHPVEQKLRARVMGYAPQELVGEVQQGDSKIIMLAEDIELFPLPIRARSTDSVIVGGQSLKVQAVDDRTRRVAGVLIAYEIRARG